MVKSLFEKMMFLRRPMRQLFDRLLTAELVMDAVLNSDSIRLKLTKEYTGKYI